MFKAITRNLQAIRYGTPAQRKKWFFILAGLMCALVLMGWIVWVALINSEVPGTVAENKVASAWSVAWSQLRAIQKTGKERMADMLSGTDVLIEQTATSTN